MSTADATVAVGPAGAGDTDAILALDGLGDSSRRSLAHDLESPHRWVLVARDDAGALVGAAVLAMLSDEAHLLDVAVAPAHRRRGIGARLVTEVRALARDHLGARAMTLEVRVGNAPARAMYRRLGFVEAGTRPDYYPDGGPDGGREAAVIMWDHDLSDRPPDPTGEE